MEKLEEKKTKNRTIKTVRWLDEHHFVLIALCINFVNFLVPLLWTTINLLIVYSFLDSIMGWILMGFTTVFFAFGIFLHIKNKNILYNLGILIGLTPLYAFIGYWTVYHWLLAAVNVLAFIVLLKSTKRKRLLPRFKSLFGKIGALVLIFNLIFPVAAYFIMPMLKIPVEVEDNSAENLEINWMWAEIWEMDDEVLDALKYCNNLDNINVSVMVGLPEDIMLSNLYTNFMLNETEKLNNHSITWDFMPLLPLDEYGYDGLYINDITIDRYMGTIEFFDYWVNENNLTDDFRVICIDTELYWEKRNDLYWDWWNSYNVHEDGAEKLETAVKKMKEIEGDHPVVTATFGMHLDDFVDYDDAQFQMMQLSAFPPWNWDGVGVMIYETGVGSEYSIYSSCRAMKYYFDEASIPYIITSEGGKEPTEEDFKRMTTKFKIIKNMGFQYTGAWALTDFLYYIEDYSARDEKYKKARKIGGERFSIEDFKKMHEEINEHEGASTVYYLTFQHSAVHFGFQFVDVWLINRITYDGNWPKIKELPKI
ncbi:MAG: hypothetical protein R6U96_01920 [Promethearchaeia archaeon]